MLTGPGVRYRPAGKSKWKSRVKRPPPLCALTARLKGATDEESRQYSDSVRVRVEPFGMFHTKHRPVYRFRLFGGE